MYDGINSEAEGDSGIDLGLISSAGASYITVLIAAILVD